MVDLMINHEGKICDNCGDSVDQLVPLNDPTRIGRWWCLKCIYKEGKARFDADAKNGWPRRKRVRKV